MVHDRGARNWTMSCFMQSYEEIDASLSKLRGLFTKPISLQKFSANSVNFGFESTFVDGDFLNFLRFQEIAFINSAVTGIHRDAFFQSAKSAIDVDLSSNKIRDGGGAFHFMSKFVNARRISLANNKLSSVPGGAFKRLKDLKILDLSNNQIQLIETKAFSFGLPRNVYRLLQIDLSTNLLKAASFETDFIERRRTLAVNLILKRNELTCLQKRTFEAFLGVTFKRNRVHVDFKSEANRLSDFCAPQV